MGFINIQFTAFIAKEYLFNSASIILRIKKAYWNSAILVSFTVGLQTLRFGVWGYKPRRAGINVIFLGNIFHFLKDLRNEF